MLCFHLKWLHLINSVAAHFWGFVFEVLPSAYSERKCASSVELFPLPALCLHGSTFTQITIQLLAKNKENRETHYCSSGLPVGFIFSRGESAKHSRNNCSMCVCLCSSVCMDESVKLSAVSQGSETSEMWRTLGVVRAQIWISLQSFRSLFLKVQYVQIGHLEFMLLAKRCH